MASETATFSSPRSKSQQQRSLSKNCNWVSSKLWAIMMAFATNEFLHLTLQSFFAALSLAVDDQISSISLLSLFNDSGVLSSTAKKLCTLFFMCLNRVRQGAKDVCKPHSEHVRFTKLFLCGLLSSNNINLLMKLACTTEVQEKYSVLTSCLTDCVKSHIRSLPRLKLEDGCRVHVLPRFVWLIRYIFETQNKSVAKLAVRGISDIYIKLTYCNICSSDCSALTFILLHIPNSIALEMDNNNINDYGVEQLLPSFSKLTVLRLSVNQITDHGACILAEELRKYQQIKSLGLSKNHLSDVGARAIAQLIEGCPSLVFLSLAANQISPEGGKHLATALRSNNALKIFWLTQNYLDDGAAKSFAKMLKINTSLESLWLIENEITSGATYLLQSLEENRAIKEICLKDNKIPTEDIEILVKDKRMSI